MSEVEYGEFRRCVRAECDLIIRGAYEGGLESNCHGKVSMNQIDNGILCKKGYYVCEECFPKECIALNPNHSDHFVFHMPRRSTNGRATIEEVSCRYCGNLLYAFHKTERYIIREHGYDHSRYCIMRKYPFPSRIEVEGAKIGTIQWI